MVLFWHKLRLSQPWKYKAPTLIACVYIVLLKSEVSALQMASWIGMSFITIIGIAGIGYLINDFSDRETDRIAGKANFFSTYNVYQAFIVLLILLVMAFAPWFYFPANRWSLVLLTAELACFVLYALPPFRLKKNIWLAPLLDAAYAHLIPALLAVHTFLLITNTTFSLSLLVSIAGWQGLLGIRFYMNHLVADRSNDLLGYDTLATRFSAHYLRPGLTLAIALELVFFHFMVYMAGGITALAVVSLTLILAAHHQPFVYSFRQNVPDKFYRSEFPVLLLLALCIQHAPYLILLLIHFIIFPTFTPSLWQSIKKKTRNALSVTANYGIYYFRKIILLQSESKARREHYISYRNKKNNQMKATSSGTLTIANLNRDKYSETYVHEYQHKLPFGVDFIYGGYPPLYDQDGLPLKKKTWLKRNTPEQVISDRLTSTRSRLVLAHFGPMAVSMLRPCQTAGVPLVAYFHAYDIHHKQQLETHLEAYRELFVHSHLLLCSSQEIRQKLQEFGASPQKTMYLPAYVDLANFSYSDHSSLGPEVLAVGRFADTKAPHLTLLAFAEVLKKVPDAHLTMIGEGELLEATITLARSLGIDSNVTFAGAQPPSFVREAMQKARVFVQHSSTTPLHGDREGTPVAIMEAMASGLPVVSTRHAGISELIEHEDNGLLVNEQDVQDMARQLLRCLESNELVTKLGKNASESIRSNHLIADHMNIITELVNTYGL